MLKAIYAGGWLAVDRGVGRHGKPKGSCPMTLVSYQPNRRQPSRCPAGIRGPLFYRLARAAWLDPLLCRSLPAATGVGEEDQGADADKG